MTETDNEITFCPSDWNKWCKAVKNGDVSESKECRAQMNRFAARYRAAKLFGGVQLTPHATAEWQRGFSALLKVFLAYTAAESFRRARGEEDPITINLNDSSLAEVLRDNERLITFLRAETRRKLSGEVKAFQNKESDDVGRVAAAVRHLVAHGTLTVDGANVGTLKRSKCLLKLSEAVLKLSNTEFSQFCQDVTRPR